MPLAKVQKSEWLNIGATRFAEKGLEGINVEQMSRQLNCNKASFYWHFNSKEQFFNDMIKHWFNNSVEPIMTTLDAHADPKKRFESFLRTSFKDKSRKDLMFYLRKLATDRPKLQELLEDLTRKRLEFTVMLLQDLGYSHSDASIKAKILLNFYIGWYEYNKNKNDSRGIEEAIKLIRDFIKF
ncbi:MAG: TetR/AcrR family transcriptional regulator [Cyclobacteriaceae bacterium]